MQIIRTRQLGALIALLIVIGLAPASISATPDGDQKEPELPSPLCDRLKVEAGNKVHSHVYATGTQIYRWDGLSWVFVEPAATLYANADYDGKVGTHYRGPTWESNSGSKVVASRLYGCTPDATAIPWLLLEAVSTSGPGIYSSVSFVQRVNTTGGLAPAYPGLVIGQTAEVPYTAEYYFYREQ